MPRIYSGKLQRFTRRRNRCSRAIHRSRPFPQRSPVHQFLRHSKGIFSVRLRRGCSQPVTVPQLGQSCSTPGVTDRRRVRPMLIFLARRSAYHYQLSLVLCSSLEWPIHAAPLNLNAETPPVLGAPNLRANHAPRNVANWSTRDPSQVEWQGRGGNSGSCAASRIGGASTRARRREGKRGLAMALYSLRLVLDRR